MRFDSGLYIHSGDVANYPPKEEWIATARLLESTGFTGVWIAEHHFFWDGWLQPTPPNPVLLGAYLAAVTTRLRIGQCGVCLPDWHPLRVAEDVAMLDHLTGGRVDFGMIRGLNGPVSGNFNPNADRRDQDTNQALFWESLDIIEKAWSNEPWHHAGQFYRFPCPGWRDETANPKDVDPRYYAADGELIALSVLPKPFQPGGPPRWLMADSVSSTIKGAERGLGVMSWGQSFEATRAAWAAYRTALSPDHSAAPRRLAIMRPVFVAATADEADAVMRPSINILMEHAVGKTASWRSRRAFLAADEELTSRDESDDWYDFLNRHEWCFVGPPDLVVDRLKRFQAGLGCEHLVLYWALPALNVDMVTASIRLFADKVMPCF